MGTRSNLAQAFAALAIIVALCLLRWGDCLGEFFFLDDYWLLDQAAQIRADPASDLPRIFVPGHMGFLLYRPLTTVGYFVALGNLFGVDAFAYHAVQLFVAISNVFLVYALARRLTRSWAGGLATALLYASAPGQLVAVFWIAAFTMTGTATLLFAMLWVWLAAEGWCRRAGVAVLQVLALLASEHAITGPVLLVLVAWASPERRPRWADLAAPIVLVAVYLTAKALFVDPDEASGGYYALTLNPLVWLTSIGYYAAACFNILTLYATTPIGWALVGAGVLVLASVAGLRAWADARWRVASAGVAIFLAGLIPFLALAQHRYAYFIGVAAFGAALAVVATCQQLVSWWRPLTLALVVALNLVDVFTAGRAGRDSTFTFIVKGGRAVGAWYAAVDAAAVDENVQKILVPKTPMTEVAFGDSHLERLFMRRPVPVRFERQGTPPETGGVIVVREAPTSVPAWPGSSQRRNWSLAGR